MQTLFAVCENQKIRRSHRLEVRGRCAKPICLPLTSHLSFYTVPMIVDTAKLATPILWTAG